MLLPFLCTGETALMFGAVSGSKQAVEFLLQSGADPHRTSKCHVNALIAAAGKGHTEVQERELGFMDG